MPSVIKAKAFNPATTTPTPTQSLGVPSDWVNKNLQMDGLKLLKKIPPASIATCFFDPQYRGILDKQKYGNEGQKKEKRRVNLVQMNEATIINFMQGIHQALKPSGHLFLWVDKFHLCEGVNPWLGNTTLQIVDLIVWEKPNIGMGYRTRNKCEFLLVMQKKPIRAKGCWTIHNIPNVWEEKVSTKEHPHAKPIGLQTRLIEATTKKDDMVLDPAMGSGSTLQASQAAERNFIGGDINGTHA